MLAAKSELQFDRVQELARNIKMKVNCKKTQILCIHSDTSSNVTSYIRSGETIITSGQKLKILGFHFDSNPSAVSHVTEVINNFYGKLWILRFLKKSGMASKDLLRVYFTVIRSAVEYCSIIYNPLIPQYMSDKLEQVQRQAMRIVYGRGVDYGELLNSGELETLKARREDASLKFAKKASSTERFGPIWFPKNDATRTVRDSTRKTFKEKMCRTERGRNNPIQYMIRQLNEID